MTCRMSFYKVASVGQSIVSQESNSNICSRSGESFAANLTRERFLLRIYNQSVSQSGSRHVVCGDKGSHASRSMARGRITYVSGDGALDGRLLCTNAYTRYKQRARLENLDLVPRCQTDPVVVELHPRCLPPSERWRQTVQH
jgi:hypothetical protein